MMVALSNSRVRPSCDECTLIPDEFLGKCVGLSPCTLEENGEWIRLNGTDRLNFLPGPAFNFLAGNPTTTTSELR